MRLQNRQSSGLINVEIASRVVIVAVVEWSEEVKVRLDPRQWGRRPHKGDHRREAVCRPYYY